MALNIILTDGRKQDGECRVGEMGGFWADSFRTSDTHLTVGTNFRDVSGSNDIAELVNLKRAELENSLGKLIHYGVAKSIEVTSSIKDFYTYEFLVKINGPGPVAVKLGLTGKNFEGNFKWV
jgi:phage gp46-like protein